MAVVDTNFPSEIGLRHQQDGGTADWNVIVEDFNFEVTIDNTDEIYRGDWVTLKLEVGGESANVGRLSTENSFETFAGWIRDDDEQGNFSLSGSRDDDSSRIVAQHDAATYDGVRPGEGEWVLRNNTRNLTVVREPVTVVPRWVSAGVLSLEGCSASATDLRPGDRTTISTNIDNPGYDPLAGEAIAFVGGAEEAIPFEVSPRGNTSVEATFEANENGTLEYGFDLENVAHNY